MKRAFKVGYGYDSHRFLNDEEKKLQSPLETETEFYSPDKKLIMGGVILDDKYQTTFGPFKARSDGDVLYHATVNAILSALNIKEARDIGTLFPNSDATNSNRDSKDFMHKAADLVKASDYELLDLKIMVKSKPRVDFSKVEKNLHTFFSFQSLTPEIHIQGTSGEDMDGAGLGLGVEVYVVCLLQNKHLNFGS